MAGARCCAVAGVTLLLLFFYSPRNSPSRATFGLFGAIALAAITQTRRQNCERHD
ncbi:hypothetical protein HNI00_21905 [Thermoleptolyngbya oregonensis NK1-22]|uniref:Uncharacterized protein n=1 Tax=Thermoleptolyngbya oregonensis NK1-22 TaxID=2547457 RepID=A0AA97BEB3_9CYAN|nr:hypothetical protein [Thermoleptolyngbya oregonensis]WOB45489.1 hypothetical protein HNI00_21905 [Thermoleptolyngbya oregonensis NK1-22]